MYGRISVRSSRNLRPFRGVTLRIRRYKKRGHKHELYMSVNTKGEKVERCKICKYHTKTFSYNITSGYCFLLSNLLRCYRVSAFVVLAYYVIVLYFSSSFPALLCSLTGMDPDNRAIFINQDLV